MSHHQHSAAASGLKIAFWLNLVFAILEFFGGWLAGSIALISDALHDLGDTISLGLALLLQRVAARAKPSDRYSYGLHRWTLVGALVNALILIIGSSLILRESIARLHSPTEPKGLLMLGFAILGVTVNGYAAWKNSRGKTHNERIVSWHLLEDVIGWAAVLVGSVVLLVTGWTWIDPALAIAISIFILISLVRPIREVASTFLQGVPADLDLSKIRSELESLPGISSIHHLHAWSLDGERHVLSCHAVLAPGAGVDDYLETKKRARAILSRKFAGHVTIELEFEREGCPGRAPE